MYRTYQYEFTPFDVYLDNIRNLKLTSDKVPAMHVGGVGGYFTICKLDRDGNMTKGKLFNLRKGDLEVWPAELSKISPEILVGRAVSKKRSKMMKIVFEP